MLGTAVLVHQYAQQVGAVVGTMATQYQDLVRLQTDFALAAAVPPAPEAEQAALPLDPDWRVVELRDLTFAYGDAPALHGIDLTLARGRRIALIGESGCGKSTLLRVLAGLYGRQPVRIQVDGRERPDLGHLGAAATLIPQEAEIFEGTLAHNVTLGLDHGEAELARAVQAAALAPMLAGLPGGLEAPVEERGANFSGGQRQRIALARGFLAAAGSGLILLDEPTSSLDPDTEQRVYDALMAHFPDACIVSAIHRLHLLERFDTVVAMDGGRIVDVGTPATVLARRAVVPRAAA
jgi:ABC-type multidrug transport system fused ATPase/permease subunit